MDKASLFKLSGLPDPFGVVILSFSFILLLAPYFSGADFGLFKIPIFTQVAKRWLKIIGPVMFLVCLLSFAPLFSVEHKDASTTNTNVPTDSTTASATPNPNSGHAVDPKEVKDAIKIHTFAGDDLKLQESRIRMATEIVALFRKGVNSNTASAVWSIGYSQLMEGHDYEIRPDLAELHREEMLRLFEYLRRELGAAVGDGKDEVYSKLYVHQNNMLGDIENRVRMSKRNQPPSNR